MAPGDSVELLARWRDGDQSAAAELVARYSERLLAVVRGRLSEKLARRLDPEDVLQSAYRSFFAGARDDRYVLAKAGDLWALLVAITLHKLHHQVARHTAGRRSVEAEEAADLVDRHGERLARQPSPDEAAAVVDELRWLMAGLTVQARTVLEMRLQGADVAEIAAATQRSERLVRRVLSQVREKLEQRYQESSGG